MLGRQYFKSYGCNKEFADKISLHVPVITILYDDLNDSLKISINGPANLEEINNLIENIWSEILLFLGVQFGIVFDEWLLQDENQLKFLLCLFKLWDQGDETFQSIFAQNDALSMVVMNYR